MPHPCVFWYRLNGMDAQQSSCNTFFIYISNANWMKYSLQIPKNKNIFKRHIYPFPNALNIKYFWTLSYNHWEFLGITKLSNPSLQEKGMPKKRLGAALLSHSVHRGINPLDGIEVSTPSRKTPSYFLPSPLQIVQAPLFRQFPIYIVFLWPSLPSPKNWWAPIILLFFILNPILSFKSK